MGNQGVIGIISVPGESNGFCWIKQNRFAHTQIILIHPIRYRLINFISNYAGQASENVLALDPAFDLTCDKSASI